MTNLEYPDWGSLGTKVLTARVTELEARAHRRMMTSVELSEKRGAEKALADLEAVRRARERITDGMSSLDVVRLQMDELDKAGLTYDCLNYDDIVAIREQDAKA